MRNDGPVEEIELAVLLEAIHRRYGYELRDWAAVRVRSRVRALVEEGGFQTISGLQERVLRDVCWMDRLLAGLWSQPSRGLFADPPFWHALRTRVVPTLRTWPTVRAWVAGCSTGDDAWSLAMLLDEEGLCDRVRIYATDIDATALDVARTATVTHAQVVACEANYRASGGAKPISTYFASTEEDCTLRPALRERVVYGRHVPGVDGAFNEFTLILFRNPFVWTGGAARDKIAALLRDSQALFGFLCLDHADTLRALPAGPWELVDPDLAIVRRVG